MRHIGEEVYGHRPEIVTVQRSIIVEKKIVLVTRERENGEGLKEIGKGAKAPYKTLGFITIVEGCRDKAARDGGARGSRINTMRLSISLSLAPSSISVLFSRS